MVTVQSLGVRLPDRHGFISTVRGEGRKGRGWHCIERCVALVLQLHCHLLRREQRQQGGGEEDSPGKGDKEKGKETERRS
jgi:hypothetical protein